jgi:short-subunit dehydrogenase
MKCKDHVVVITGASMGIGEAVARELVAQGARVVMTSRSAERLQEAAARIASPAAITMACDVSSPEQIAKLPGEVSSRLGRIDGWINNAGYGMLDTIESMSLDKCRELFETNFFGAIACMQAVIPVMKRQGRGTIVNVSSVVGHLPLPYMSTYCASKHALNALSESAHLELAPAGIRVVSVCPGRVRTEFNRNTVRGSNGRRLGENIQRGISAERCAKAIVRAYVSGAREVFVPWHGWWTSHLYELCPAVVEIALRRMMK